MSNQLAIILGLIIALLMGYDGVVNGGHNILFLARKFTELMAWMTFWR